MEARAEDPLGVATALHKAGAPLVVTVLPNIAFLESCVLYPDIGLKHDWSGRHGFQSVGASEFRGIRPHQPGEPLSHIELEEHREDGRLDAAGNGRTGRRRTSPCLPRRHGLRDWWGGTDPNSNFELAVRHRSSIADFVLRSGRGVSLVKSRAQTP